MSVSQILNWYAYRNNAVSIDHRHANHREANWITWRSIEKHIHL